MKSEDITKLPYAPWLEDTIREMTEHEVQAICIAVKVDGDAMLTGYWNADTQDKAMSAAAIQNDIVSDIVEQTADAIKRAMEEGDE